MSGIIGIYYIDGRPVEREDLGRALDRLSHRGPDDTGLWIQESVGLGHRMLWTTPESLHERLPSVNQTGDLVITADARIDNRDDLIKTLGFTDHPRSIMTDSQLILASYEEWGECCTEKLLGDFAFAIWDMRKKLLFCGRDHFGVRPFYYYSSSGVFIFASEIKSLLCLPDVPCQLNELKVGDHLTSFLDDKTITFYKDILRLPPSHSISINREGVKLRAYWSLDPSRELPHAPDEEYDEAFRHVFTEAVRCRLRSAFPVGSLLSGGLDSSSVSCVARVLLLESTGLPLHTFSSIYNEVTQCDERQFVNSVLAQGKVKPHYVYGDQLSPFTDMSKIHWHIDEPVSAGNLFLSWALNGSAKDHGVRVLLDGYDGDTTVSHGTGYLMELAQYGRWVTLIKEASGYAKHFNLPPHKVIWYWVSNYGYGLKPAIYNSQLLKEVKRIKVALFRLRNNNPQPFREFIINPRFANRINLADRRQYSQQDKPATQREAHHRRLSWGVHSNILELDNNCAAAFHVEKRFPFWDKRLVEYCLSLPPDQKLRQGWDRVIMRRALAGILPKEVQWRNGKTDMSPNLKHVLFKFDRQQMEEVVFERSSVIEDYVDVAVLGDTYKKFLSNEAADESFFRFFRVITLALWLKDTGLAA